MLRIAVQAKGRLYDETMSFFGRIGYKVECHEALVVGAVVKLSS